MLVIVIRTLILYATVIASMRFMGKRQIGELQPSELVVAIMISDLACVPMQDISIPILSGILPVLTLVIAEVAMSFFSLKSDTVRKIVTGEPSIIIYNGHVNEHELERLRFNLNDLMEELRSNSCHNIADVEVAVLETNGKLSVIPKASARNVTVDDMNIAKPRPDGLPYMLISDGRLDEDELKRSGRSRRWLENKLRERSINGVEEVFIASLDENGEMFIQKKGGGDKK